MKRILLGITGGVACYKSLELVRELMRRNYEVTCVLTSAAGKMITPLLCEAITGNRAYTDLFESGEMLHIRLEREADAVVIAPATANFLAKADLGIGDDLLSTILLSRTQKPVLFAPAMNREMYLNPVVQEHIRRLQEKGCIVLPVGEGSLACGEEGPGRMLEPEEIADYVEYSLTQKIFSGLHFLVTAGPTREFLDGVRFLSNPASGKLGYEIARRAAFAGGDVVLVSGPTNLPHPPFCRTIEVENAEQMRKACEEHLEGTDILVMTAAVTDMRPGEIWKGKVRREDWQERSISFTSTPDILSFLASRKGNRFFVGFAAEWGLDEPHSWMRKLQQKSLDLLVVNDISTREAGFASDRIRALLLYPDGESSPVWELSKKDFALRLLEEIRRLLNEGGKNI
ncbi:MAG: bifunctional phosphopantothenoylcysteine decarboxylase/phosphopantothenate--cysteine ligase CoaBC [bacterium JZ-2024 1]